MICHLIKVVTGFIFALKSHNAAFFPCFSKLFKVWFGVLFYGIYLYLGTLRIVIFSFIRSHA